MRRNHLLLLVKMRRQERMNLKNKKVEINLIIMKKKGIKLIIRRKRRNNSHKRTRMRVRRRRSLCRWWIPHRKRILSMGRRSLRIECRTTKMALLPTRTALSCLAGRSKARINKTKSNAPSPSWWSPSSPSAPASAFSAATARAGDSLPITKVPGVPINQEHQRVLSLSTIHRVPYATPQW